MDFEAFVQSLFGFVKNSENLYFVLYAVATCLLTQLFKKLLVSKVKVDVLHKFDFATLFPFVFGLIFAVVDVFLVKGVRAFSVGIASEIAISATTIGAFATVIFKFCSSLSGQSLNSLLSNDTFAVFYTQLLYFGTARQKLLNKTLSFKDFVSEVKLLASNATDIYKGEDSDEAKKAKLANLLLGIVDDESISACVNSLHIALKNQATPKTK